MKWIRDLARMRVGVCWYSLPACRIYRDKLLKMLYIDLWRLSIEIDYQWSMEEVN